MRGLFYICHMEKRLYRTAFISSPIIALIGATPIYIVERVQNSKILLAWSILTMTIFAFWVINILIIQKINTYQSNKRYLLSYMLVLLLQSIVIFSLSHLRPLQVYPLMPFFAAIGINTIIIILCNTILLQFKNESAEIEIQQLKISNLEAQKQMLLQQLQPHFLFNALSTLKSLIKENPVMAENYTLQLSEFLRYSSQAKDREIVTLKDELQFTQDYINLQSVRFGTAFSCEIDIPFDVVEKKVPVYALQSLVENAIKHNSFNEKKPLIIKITIIDSFVVVINNKRTKVLQQPSGTGLQNLMLRYKIVAEKSIKINDGEDEFTVEIPLLE